MVDTKTRIFHKWVTIPLLDVGRTVWAEAGSSKIGSTGAPAPHGWTWRI